MTHPKVRFLRPNKVFGAQKFFLGPPKFKEIDFLKKPEFCDLSEHGGWSGSGPRPPDSVYGWFNLLNPLPALGPCC